MGTLNSPSSRVVKDSTPSRRRILRYVNFGIGESSPILFLDMVNPHLIIFEARWILNEHAFYRLLFSLFQSESWPRKKKTNQLGESSHNFTFAVVNLDPIILKKKWTDGESWPKDFVEKVNRGEHLRWVGSRCPLTRALVFAFTGMFNSHSLQCFTVGKVYARYSCIYHESKRNQFKNS